MEYNPSAVGIKNGNIFGFPFSAEESKVIIIPVPWDVTVSYRAGTADGPEAILAASPQLDTFTTFAPEAWKQGIAMLEAPRMRRRSEIYRKQAADIIEALEAGEPAEKFAAEQRELNLSCEAMCEWVHRQATMQLSAGKIPVVLGGDHSTPLGLMQALGEHVGEFGILHIDAHCDLRDAYEGFTYSHASIMFNALKIPAITRLVQVGIRDFCLDEYNVIQQSAGRVVLHEDRTLQAAKFKGELWHAIASRIVSALPERVYISFDIDGLDPAFCPNTGTPVVGGLQYEEAMYLIEEVVRSGRTIVGADLVEVANSSTDETDEWDANVGARVLYRLCVAALASQNRSLLG